MNAPARPFVIEFHGDASLGEVLKALAPHADKALVIDYGGKTIRPGYHVTEVKAGSFVTLDCGGNPDAWRETILQVEDLAPASGQDFMLTGKFRSILDQVEKRMTLDLGARLTFEVGPPAAPMQVFDVDALRVGVNEVVLQLGARPAICKPRHRSQQPETQVSAALRGLRNKPPAARDVAEIPPSAPKVEIFARVTRAQQQKS